MLGKIKKIFSKYREIVLYLVFGVGTTLVDWIIRFIFLKEGMSLSLVHTIDATAWFAAVTFAYVTNRIFVFKSNARGAKGVGLEILKFAGSRVTSFLIQEGIVFLIYGLLPPPAVVVTTSIIVVILNYVFSKLIVFRGGKKRNE